MNQVLPETNFSDSFDYCISNLKTMVCPLFTVHLMPPYIISDTEIAHLGRAVNAALGQAVTA